MIDFSSGDYEYLYANSLQRELTDEDGWAIDVLANSTYPWYGYAGNANNPGGVREGSNSPSNPLSAVLFDNPGGYPQGYYWFEAIDVPVCLDSQSPC